MGFLSIITDRNLAGSNDATSIDAADAAVFVWNKYKICEEEKGMLGLFYTEKTKKKWIKDDKNIACKNM